MAWAWGRTHEDASNTDRRSALQAGKGKNSAEFPGTSRAIRGIHPFPDFVSSREIDSSLRVLSREPRGQSLYGGSGREAFRSESASPRSSSSLFSVRMWESGTGISPQRTRRARSPNSSGSLCTLWFNHFLRCDPRCLPPKLLTSRSFSAVFLLAPSAPVSPRPDDFV